MGESEYGRALMNLIILSGNLFGTLTNSEDPEEIILDVASHEDLH